MNAYLKAIWISLNGKNNLQRKLDRHISFYYFLLGDISYLVLGKVFSRIICSYFAEHFYSLTPLQRFEVPFRKWKSKPSFVFKKRPNQGKSILFAVTSFFSNLNSTVRLKKTVIQRTPVKTNMARFWPPFTLFCVKAKGRREAFELVLSQ